MLCEEIRRQRIGGGTMVRSPGAVNTHLVVYARLYLDIG